MRRQTAGASLKTARWKVPPYGKFLFYERDATFIPQLRKESQNVPSALRIQKLQESPLYLPRRSINAARIDGNDLGGEIFPSSHEWLARSCEGTNELHISSQTNGTVFQVRRSHFAYDMAGPTLLAFYLSRERPLAVCVRAHELLGTGPYMDLGRV